MTSSIRSRNRSTARRWSSTSFNPTSTKTFPLRKITAVSQTQLAFSPPGTTPPFVLSYNASSVPILPIGAVERHDSRGANLRPREHDPADSTRHGRRGLDPVSLRRQAASSAGGPRSGKRSERDGLSANDVVAAIGAQNLILPAGTEKIGSLEYFIKLNASPTQIEDLNNLPIRAHNGNVTYVRDVAHLRDGYSPQTNIVRLDGRRAILMSVLKTGKASTIDIINGINEKLPQIRGSLPSALKIEPISDQSVFVRAAISGVVREAVIAGGNALTGLVILLFLGSWRSTLIIADLNSAIDSRLGRVSVGARRDH